MRCFISVVTMLSVCTVVLCALIQGSWSIDPFFPRNFKFGAASAAYQIEGGWNADGKGENVWDRYVHKYPGDLANNASGDVSADSYHQWREDVKAAAEMKLQFYRFSISWSRILPTGFANKINPAGVKYYNDLIDGLLAEGVEPIVTLYHWDLPVKIQDLGGWTNPLVVKWFGAYARVAYSLYADRVKTWLTINEPNVVCDIFYMSGRSAPRIRELDLAPYLCNRHILLAHAEAYRIFDREFRPRYAGRVSFAHNALWIEPLNPEDEALAELGRQHQTGRYCHPIYSERGGWPPSIEKLMLELSLRQGYKESRLPPFSEEEKAFVRGTADFFGMNYYTTYMIRPARPEDEPGVWFLSGSPELNATLEYPQHAYYGAAAMLPVVPDGIRKQMAWMKREYGDVNIIITENGFTTAGSQLLDYDRINFIKEHLEQVLLSIKADNVNVTGYGVWSLIDDLEWLAGYTSKFGLYEIDFDHPNRTRTARASSHYYACVIETRTYDVPESCFEKNYPTLEFRRMGIQNGGSVSVNGGLFIQLFAMISTYLLSIRLY